MSSKYELALDSNNGRAKTNDWSNKGGVDYVVSMFVSNLGGNHILRVVWSKSILGRSDEWGVTCNFLCSDKLERMVWKTLWPGLLVLSQD